MYCLHLGDDFSITGTSPEVHARCIGKDITVRPIAGTRVRGKNEQEDNELAAELLADPKERAEHIMLVDLARNDVGRISKTGSIKIPDLMTIEKYSHVMHIVSDVTGTLKEGLESSETMSSTFPAGTVSGAPKIRAMQIISELEKSRRGPYAGTIAYFSFDGNIDSCITIRTVIMKDKKAYIQAGAGIVADSDPEFEFEETHNKAKAMMVALGAAKEMSQF
jgi:anthranilate synthase component 1